MGAKTMLTNHIGWLTVDNLVDPNEIEASLVQSLNSKRRIKRRTKALNIELRKFGPSKSYSQYVETKTAILRHISDNEDTDDDTDTYRVRIVVRRNRSLSPVAATDDQTDDSNNWDNTLGEDSINSLREENEELRKEDKNKNKTSAAENCTENKLTKEKDMAKKKNGETRKKEKIQSNLAAKSAKRNTPENKLSKENVVEKQKKAGVKKQNKETRKSDKIKSDLSGKSAIKNSRKNKSVKENVATTSRSVPDSTDNVNADSINSPGKQNGETRKSDKSESDLSAKSAKRNSKENTSIKDRDTSFSKSLENADADLRISPRKENGETRERDKIKSPESDSQENKSTKKRDTLSKNVPDASGKAVSTQERELANAKRNLTFELENFANDADENDATQEINPIAQSTQIHDENNSDAVCDNVEESWAINLASLRNAELECSAKSNDSQDDNLMGGNIEILEKAEESLNKTGDEKKEEEEKTLTQLQEQPVLDGSLTKKSQPVITSTEIVTSKYKIVRDDDDADSSAASEEDDDVSCSVESLAVENPQLSPGNKFVIKEEMAASVHELSPDSKLDGQLKQTPDKSQTSPIETCLVDDEATEVNEVTPERKRVSQMKRMNLLSNSSDSEESQDSEEENDRVDAGKNIVSQSRIVPSGADDDDDDESRAEKSAQEKSQSSPKNKSATKKEEEEEDDDEEEEAELNELSKRVNQLKRINLLSNSSDSEESQDSEEGDDRVDARKNIVSLSRIDPSAADDDDDDESRVEKSAQEKSQFSPKNKSAIKEQEEDEEEEEETELSELSKRVSQLKRINLLSNSSDTEESQDSEQEYHRVDTEDKIVSQSTINPSAVDDTDENLAVEKSQVASKNKLSIKENEEEEETKVNELTSESKLDGQQEMALDESRISPKGKCSVDEQVIEVNELTPERKRVSQLKRINLLSNSSDSEESQDSEKGEDDRVNSGKNVASPSSSTRIDDPDESQPEKIGYRKYPTSSSQVISDPSDVDEPIADPKKRNSGNKFTETNKADSIMSEEEPLQIFVRLPVTKSIKRQIIDQENAESFGEFEKIEKAVEEKIVKKKRKKNDFGAEVNAPAISSDNADDCKAGEEDSDNSKRINNGGKPIMNDVSCEGESLRYVLKYLSRRTNDDDDGIINSPLTKEGGKDDSDYPSQHSNEIPSRPVELCEFIEREGLVATHEPSTITAKDIKKCVQENGDEEIWLMEIPRSIIKRGNELCGKKMSFENGSMTINDITYKTTCRDEKSVTCILSAGKKKARHKTVNVEPVGCIVVRQESSEQIPLSASSLHTIQPLIKSDAAKQKFCSNVPFPKNLKSRDPLLGRNLLGSPNKISPKKDTREIHELHGKRKRIRDTDENSKSAKSRKKSKRKVWHVDNFTSARKKKKQRNPSF